MGPPATPGLRERAVHPFLLKLFCSTPFTASAAAAPGSTNSPCDLSPTSSPARSRPANPASGPGRAESPARPNTLRNATVATPVPGRRSENGIFTTIHAAAAFHIAGRVSSASGAASKRSSWDAARLAEDEGAGGWLPPLVEANRTPRPLTRGDASTILARKTFDSGKESPTVERSNGSVSTSKAGVRAAPQVLLGDRSVAEVMSNFVKPESVSMKTNYLWALLGGACKLEGVEGDCFNADLHERDGNHEYWRRSQGEKIYGPVTYFVSHCWQYKLGDLVGMILQHYDELPETDGGRLYVPVYYWVDIFAVTQHFVGDFTEHPDADFKGVIESAKGGVLFSMAPWRNPLSVKRVWCLFEALTALSLNREINLMTDPFDSTAKVDILLPLFTRQVVEMLDVRNAEATVEKDRDYIMALAERTLGINRFNQTLRTALYHEICEAMILRAVVTGETDEGRKLLERGIIISNATLRFMPKRDSAGKEVERIRDSGLALLADAVKSCPKLESLVVYTAAETDVTPNGLTTLAKGLAGHPALKHLVVGRHPLMASIPGTGGSLGRTSVSSYASLLSANRTLTHLDLSYNKLGPDGVVALAPALAGNRTLAVLKLRQVGMDGASAITLADNCMTAEGLRDLDISFNPDMGDKAAPALLKLMSHKGLTVLRAQCCRLGWQTGKALIGDQLTRAGSIRELSLGCVVQNSSSSASQDTIDWNHLLVDTSGPNGGRTYRSAPAHGDALVALAGALRQGFKTLERLDLRGCFLGTNVGGESAGLRDALISGLTSVRRGAAFGSLRLLDMRSCNQPELLKMEDGEIELLLKHGGLNLLIKEYKRTGIKGGVLRQYVQYDA
ncbi:hypothetical protein VaNZ11_003277 [Volvox africanus]|uniref:Uncharacterized protein n=1 Tax=Volvox africanus TaxID=51714 RepID=A0ABQ5RUP3_9CHLO|nr:hypothetical protein VaNZ11_003277 [Volvox africanus]